MSNRSAEMNAAFHKDLLFLANKAGYKVLSLRSEAILFERIENGSRVEVNISDIAIPATIAELGMASLAEKYRDSRFGTLSYDRILMRVMYKLFHPDNQEKGKRHYLCIEVMMAPEHVTEESYCLWTVPFVEREKKAGSEIVIRAMRDENGMLHALEHASFIYYYLKNGLNITILEMDAQDEINFSEGVSGSDMNTAVKIFDVLYDSDYHYDHILLSVPPQVDFSDDSEPGDTGQFIYMTMEDAIEGRYGFPEDHEAIIINPEDM